jgi:hypothetical protein
VTTNVGAAVTVAAVVADFVVPPPKRGVTAIGVDLLEPSALLETELSSSSPGSTPLHPLATAKMAEIAVVDTA